jgi:hypothetical protein
VTRWGNPWETDPHELRRIADSAKREAEESKNIIVGLCVVFGIGLLVYTGMTVDHVGWWEWIINVVGAAFFSWLFFIAGLLAGQIVGWARDRWSFP